MSPAQYQRAKTVVQAAEDEAAEPEVWVAAVEVVRPTPHDHLVLTEDQAAETERHRCHDHRDGQRCQLMAMHPQAHAAMTAPDTRTRWDASRSWVEVEDYRLSIDLEQLPWGPSYPRVIPLTER